MYRNIVAVGDCNTLGAKKLKSQSYPEILGSLLGAKVTNLGHTMATSREGRNLLGGHIDSVDCVIIQFGLVDSYKTFKYSPYVLYYPDNPIRKTLRSLTKKYKKICRNIGLNQWLGEVNVVPLDEYERNIRNMIEMSLPRTIILPDTLPNKQLHRNPDIERYNSCLKEISRDYQQCINVDLFKVFLENFDTYYLDSTHANGEGYRYIAERIKSCLS